ncbi:MAG: VanZ family protein [Actinomycetota bacterium]
MSARRALRAVDVAIWAVALGALGTTLWYSLGAAPPGTGTDRQLHALAYFVDTFAILLAVVWRPGRDTDRRVGAWTVVIALALLALGAVIEIAQGRFAGRVAQLSDWVADAAGIVLAVAAFGVLRVLARPRAH